MGPFDITMLEGLFSESELLTMQSSLKSSITGGSIGTAIQSVGTRDLTTTFIVNTPPELALKAVAYALYKLDPVTYPAPSFTKSKQYFCR